MTTQPNWSPTDDDTADLLTVLADDGRLCVEEEWDRFVSALERAARFDGEIWPNELRPLVRGVVKPNRIGAFTNRACRQGLIAATGQWEISNDTTGRNSGRPMRVYRWLAGAR